MQNGEDPQAAGGQSISDKGVLLRVALSFSLRFWLSLVMLGMKAFLLRLMLNCTASFRLSHFCIDILPPNKSCM